MKLMVSEHIERIVSIAEAELFIGTAIIVCLASETLSCTTKARMRQTEKTGW